MVPRHNKEPNKLGSVRNFLEPDDFSTILLRESQTDDDNNFVSEPSENIANEDDLDIPVTEDNFQVNHWD